MQHEARLQPRRRPREPLTPVISTRIASSPARGMDRAHRDAAKPVFQRGVDRRQRIGAMDHARNVRWAQARRGWRAAIQRQTASRSPSRGRGRGPGQARRGPSLARIEERRVGRHQIGRRHRQGQRPGDRTARVTSATATRARAGQAHCAKRSPAASAAVDGVDLDEIDECGLREAPRQRQARPRQLRRRHRRSAPLVPAPAAAASSTASMADAMACALLPQRRFPRSEIASNVSSHRAIRLRARPRVSSRRAASKGHPRRRADGAAESQAIPRPRSYSWSATKVAETRRCRASDWTNEISTMSLVRRSSRKAPRIQLGTVSAHVRLPGVRPAYLCSRRGEF